MLDADSPAMYRRTTPLPPPSTTRLLRRLHLDELHASLRKRPQPEPPSDRRSCAAHASPRIIDDDLSEGGAFLTSVQPTAPRPTPPLTRPPPLPRPVIPSLSDRLDALSGRDPEADRGTTAAGVGAPDVAPLPKPQPSWKRPVLTPRFTPRPQEKATPLEKATQEAATARVRADEAADAAAAATLAADEKQAHAKSVSGVDPTHLDALGAWEVKRAPREAALAAKNAAHARAAAEAMLIDARIASIAALAHSENDNVRALCGTHAVQTITSLAHFVKHERDEMRGDAERLGDPVHHELSRGLPLSPFHWRKFGGPPRPPPPRVQPRGTVRARGAVACSSPQWRF